MKWRLPRWRTVKCAALLASPNGLQALAAIKAAKKAGLIRSKEECLELAGDAEKLAEVVGSGASFFAGETAKCACRRVF